MRKRLCIAAGLIALLVILAQPVAASGLQGKTVVLDPGHGANTGARGVTGTIEDHNVLAIALKARDMLEAAGARVVMTRTTNHLPYVPDMPNASQLLARMTIANRSGADLFLSIHNDWNPNPAIRGITTYYMASRGTERLARVMQAELIAATGMRNVGTISREYYVLKNTTIPAALLEIGFLSNREDERLLLLESTRHNAALGIYNGVLRYFGVAAEQPAPEPGPSQPAPSQPAAPVAPGFTILAYWAQWGQDQAAEKSLQSHLPLMDVVSPFWYTLRRDGTLSARDTAVHDSLTHRVQSAGRKLYVMINNEKGHTVMLDDPKVRSQSIRSITEQVRQAGFDGVTIDFEALPLTSRDSFTAFVRELSALLRNEGRGLVLALEAKRSDAPMDSGADAHDYAALAQYADYVGIMTYDQHGRWSGPGPVAAIDWVEEVVRYAIQHIPREKLLLGIAGYGYNWGSDGSINYLSADEALALSRQVGASIQWDDRAQVPHFSYSQNGIAHQVWFENSYSVSRKVSLVQRYGLAGVALWRIGYEDARMWDILGAAARESATPGRPPVGGLPAHDGRTFADVDPFHWAHPYIEHLAGQGLVEGDAGQYRPADPVTRAEFAKLITGALSVSPVPHQPLPQWLDVAPGAWYHPHVQLAGQSLLMVGEADQRFYPDRPLSRQEAAVVITRGLALYQPARVTLPTGHGVGPISVYGDWEQVPVWAQYAVALTTDLGIFGGDDTGLFRPSASLSRAEAAAIVYRTLSGQFE